VLRPRDQGAKGNPLPAGGRYAVPLGGVPLRAARDRRRAHRALDDGTAGLWAIKLRGGTAIVQDPADAMHRSMPLNALDNVDVDYQLPAADMGALIARVVREEALPEPALAEDEREKMRTEVKIAAGHDALEGNVVQFGTLSAFTCPE